MNNKLSIISSGIALAFMATGSQSHAANVIWNSVQTPTADTDVSTTGTYVGSYVSTPAAGVVLNGVTFTNTFTGGITVGDNGWGYATWPNYAGAAAPPPRMSVDGASELRCLIAGQNLQAACLDRYGRGKRHHGLVKGPGHSCSESFERHD